MRKLLYFYRSMIVLAYVHARNYILWHFGEWMKRTGRILVSWGTDVNPRWSIEIFHRCYMVDAEINMGLKVYRGPIYAMGQGLFGKNRIILNFNWLASRSVFGPDDHWEFHHAGKMVLSGCSSPKIIPEKDDKQNNDPDAGHVWFSFEGGYGTVFIGKNRKYLKFEGGPSVIRKFTHF